MVKPILVYGSKMWAKGYSETIESVQVKFCEDYLRLGKTVNDCLALGKCGRLPQCCDYFLRSIKYWCKLLMMPPHRYPKQCYIMPRNQDDMGRTNWATGVKSDISPGMAKSGFWKYEPIIMHRSGRIVFTSHLGVIPTNTLKTIFKTILDPEKCVF